MNFLNLILVVGLPAMPDIAPAGLLRLAERRSIGSRRAIPNFTAQGNPTLLPAQISKSRSSSHVQQNV